MQAETNLWVAELAPEYSGGWKYGLTLRVGSSAMEPDRRIATLKTSRSSESRRAAKYLLRSRQDLLNHLVSASSTEDNGGVSKASVVAALRNLGHWVNGSGQLFRVYVIELDDDVGRKTGNASLPWLYVGETSKSTEIRIEEHLAASRNRRGPLFSRVANRHFVRDRALISTRPYNRCIAGQALRH
jgi:hypothetical protein